MSLGGLRIAQPNWAGEAMDADDLLPGGAKIDATQFTITSADVTVTLAAPANAGDVALSVQALSGPIPAGATLNFGIPGLFAVVNNAVAAAATSIPVVPLVRAIPYPATTAIVSPAGAAGAATAIPITALPGALTLPTGTVLVWSNGQTSTLTAPAAPGAVSLAVSALSGPVTAGATTSYGLMQATYKGNAKKNVPNGTIVSRTLAQRDAGGKFHPGISTDAEIMIVAFDVADADSIDDVELVMPNAGFIVKENFLPQYNLLRPAGVDSALMTALRTRFNMVLGAE